MYGWVEEAGELLTEEDGSNHRPIELDHPCTVDSDVVVDELLRPWVVIVQIAPVRVGRCEAQELRAVVLPERPEHKPCGSELHEPIVAWPTPRVQVGAHLSDLRR